MKYVLQITERDSGVILYDQWLADGGTAVEDPEEANVSPNRNIADIRAGLLLDRIGSVCDVEVKEFPDCDHCDRIGQVRACVVDWPDVKGKIRGTTCCSRCEDAMKAEISAQGGTFVRWWTVEGDVVVPVASSAFEKTWGEA